MHACIALGQASDVGVRRTAHARILAKVRSSRSWSLGDLAWLREKDIENGDGGGDAADAAAAEAEATSGGMTVLVAPADARWRSALDARRKAIVYVLAVEYVWYFNWRGWALWG